jgi:hypothetical protein
MRQRIGGIRKQLCQTLETHGYFSPNQTFDFNCYGPVAPPLERITHRSTPRSHSLGCGREWRGSVHCLFRGLQSNSTSPIVSFTRAFLLLEKSHSSGAHQSRVQVFFSAEHFELRRKYKSACRRENAMLRFSSLLFGLFTNSFDQSGSTLES